MPSITPLKSLYMAQSLEELNKKIKAEGTGKMSKMSPLIICRAGCKLFAVAQQARLEGDEEKAYLFYMRYCDVLKLVFDHADYRKHKAECDKLISKQDYKSAIEFAEKLSESLDKRYNDLRESRALAENADRLDPPQIIPDSLKTTDKKEDGRVISKTDSAEHKKDTGSAPNSSSPGSIKSEKLYYLINDPSTTVLILDARSAEDYEKSHIEYKTIINVPEEILLPGHAVVQYRATHSYCETHYQSGECYTETVCKLRAIFGCDSSPTATAVLMLAQKFKESGVTSGIIGKQLPNNVLNVWSKRGEVDFVVLVDQSSRETDLSTSKPLSVLKDAIFKWDVVTLKSEPLILEGGFTDWVLHYPMLVTNTCLSIDLIPKTQQNGVPAIDISYPDLESLLSPPKPDPPKVESPVIAPSSPIVIEQNDVIHPVVKPKTAAAIPEVDRRKKPAMKPTPIRRNSAEATPTTTTIAGNLQEEPDVIVKPREESAEKSKEKVVVVPKPPAVDRSSKPAVNSLPRTSSKSSSSLVSEGSQDGEKTSLTDESSTSKPHPKVEIPEEIVTKAEEIEPKPINEIQKSVEETQPVTINDKKIVDQVSSVETTDSPTIKSTKPSPPPPAISSAGEAKPIDIPRKSTLPAKPVNKPNAPTDTEFSYTMPLRDEGKSLQQSFLSKKSTLSRSHSSPNIAKMIEDEIENEKVQPKTQFIPHFDRALKPKLTGNLKPVNRNLSQISFGLDGGMPTLPRNFAPVYGNQGYGVTGLKNLGNTCFMNSIIQCLAATTPMALYFVNGYHFDAMSRSTKSGKKGVLAHELTQLIRVMWSGHYKSVSPVDFKNAVSMNMPMFVGNDQHDAHEFLVMLLEKLHGDLNKSQVTKPPPLVLPDDLPPREREERFWRHHRVTNDSVISDLFEGLLCSTLTCQSCGEQSNTYEVFRCLSLPIPALSKQPSLQDCLQEFSKAEYIGGDSGWDCPKCKMKRKAKKLIEVCRYPDILILQLKRFSYAGMWREKIQTYVNFPVNNFILRSSREARTYNLYAVSNHYGTLEGGHYIAYCDNSPKRRWFKYDDNEVTEISPSSVTTQAAYILFYTSRDFQQDLFRK